MCSNCFVLPLHCVVLCVAITKVHAVSPQQSRENDSPAIHSLKKRETAYSGTTLLFSPLKNTPWTSGTNQTAVRQCRILCTYLFVQLTFVLSKFRLKSRWIQKINIKLLAKLDKNGENIHPTLQEAQGKDALKEKTVFKWVQCLLGRRWRPLGRCMIWIRLHLVRRGKHWFCAFSCVHRLPSGCWNDGRSSYFGKVVCSPDHDITFGNDSFATRWCQNCRLLCTSLGKNNVALLGRVKMTAINFCKELSSAKRLEFTSTRILTD